MTQRGYGAAFERLGFFVAGAALGAAASRALRARVPITSRGELAPSALPFAQKGGGAGWRLSGALEGAVVALAGARERVLGPGPSRLDLGRLRAHLHEVPGGERVRLRDLGGGIVEALGEAPDADAVERVLSRLREEPGVAVVVNRIWTESAHGTAADLVHFRRPLGDTREN